MWNNLCVKACPTAAIGAEVLRFQCEGLTYEYNRIDNNRCDWSKRYALVGDSGFKFLGSKLDEAPEGDIDAEQLAAALKKHDQSKVSSRGL